MLPPGVYKKGSIDFLDIYREVITSLPREAGSVLTFIGVTKAFGLKEVKKLEMESYEELANSAIAEICKEVEEKYNVFLVRIYHLIGEFEVGEPLVFVVVVSRSRKEGLDALKEAIERYKSEPALWKKEIYLDDSYQWISHA
ncbi:Molybdopterin synthase catalytic subunit [archaeon HR06]|nr:Molybdopterin synthase catalytic subunit [archaeon HR06]